jgi:hypothetical protein
MDDKIIFMCIMLSAFAMVILLVWIGLLSKRHSAREKTELRKQLLNKFGSGQELTEFLATPQGQNFLIEQEMDVSRGPAKTKQRIINLAIAGIIVTLIGIGLLGLSHSEHGFVFPGVLMLSMGIGFLSSAVVAYQLNKKLGSL